MQLTTFLIFCAHDLSLCQLSLYDVLLFIDDSGSMLEGSKWRDLQAIAQQIVEMTTQFDTDGIQVSCVLVLIVKDRAIANMPPTSAFLGRVHEQPCAC